MIDLKKQTGNSLKKHIKNKNAININIASIVFRETQTQGTIQPITNKYSGKALK
jgi:ribosomal protein S25